MPGRGRANGCFVTGTDTGVGKTLATLALMRALQRRGLRVAGMKPVAAGCRRTSGGLRNADALALQRHASLRLPYGLINPYALEAPISPHLAARAAGKRIHVDRLAAACHLLAGRVDYIVVEGVGGWRAPLNDEQTVADLAAALRLPVVLVVGLRLGCISHALLSYESILAAGVKCAGWIANMITPGFIMAEKNVVAIRERITAPLLGVMPYVDTQDISVLSSTLMVDDL